MFRENQQYDKRTHDLFNFHWKIFHVFQISVITGLCYIKWKYMKLINLIFCIFQFIGFLYFSCSRLFNIINYFWIINLNKTLSFSSYPNGSWSNDSEKKKNIIKHFWLIRQKSYFVFIHYIRKKIVIYY